MQREQALRGTPVTPQLAHPGQAEDEDFLVVICGFVVILSTTYMFFLLVDS
jgi:hypothetical protein